MNEVSKNLMCIQMRSGVEIFVEKENADKLVAVLTNPNPPQFIKYEGRIINRADLVGIFKPQDMDNLTRRKNGQWKCIEGNWHDRGEKCECKRKARVIFDDKIKKAIEDCGKCDSGFVHNEKGSVTNCDCVKDLYVSKD